MNGVAYLPVLARGLPPAPDPALDPYLDAAERCFAEHGIARTSIADIAKVAGVSRTTVYRHLDSVDNILRLILARELYRFQETVPRALEDADGPAGVVRVLAALITFCRENPVLLKALDDEPEMLGSMFVAQAADAFERVADILTPPLEVAIAVGLIRPHDAASLAHWITRVLASLVVAPYPGDLNELLDEMLLPILEPARRRAR